MDDLKSIDSELVEEHRSWLRPFGDQYLKKWNDLLKSQVEPAICEASTRKLLSDHDIKVEPYEDISSGGPDFLCTKNGKSFYVEVTCITKDAMTRATGLPNEPEGSGICSSSSPTKRVLQEIVRKTKQCANLNAPCIVVVCTLHQWGGMVVTSDIEIQKLLTGEPLIGATLELNSKRFEKLRWISELYGALFARFAKTEEEKIEEARKTISAVLMFAISAKNPWSVKGLLHPNPNHPFDRTLLPEIKFCRLAKEYQTGQLTIEWI